jgi:hypothetical protein
MPTLRLVLPKYIEPEAIDFDIEEFRRAIFQKGRELVWDWAMSCPCQMSVISTGRTTLVSQNRIDCPGCKGSGIVYSNRQTTIGLLTDALFDQKFFNLYGRYSEGSVFITLLPEHLPAMNDRFTLTRGVVVYEETGFRHSATVERPRFPIVKRIMYLGSEVDQTEPERTEIGVLYCRSAGLNGQLSPTEYVEGTHFEVTDNGDLDWSIAGGSAPAIGSRLSIRYYGRPSFIVKGFPYAQRDLYQNDSATMEDRQLGLHPVKVVCIPEFFGARNPPVVDDVAEAEAEPSDELP